MVRSANAGPCTSIVVTTDSSGTGESVFLTPLTEALGWDGDAWSRADAKSPNSRYVYYTLRNQPAVVTYDTVEMTFTIGDSYMGGTIAHDGSGVIGFIDGLTQSRDGDHVYAVLNHGVHTYPHGGSMAPGLVDDTGHPVAESPVPDNEPSAPGRPGEDGTSS